MDASAAFFYSLLCLCVLNLLLFNFVLCLCFVFISASCKQTSLVGFFVCSHSKLRGSDKKKMHLNRIPPPQYTNGKICVRASLNLSIFLFEICYSLSCWSRFSRLDGNEKIENELRLAGPLYISRCMSVVCSTVDCQHFCTIRHFTQTKDSRPMRGNQSR